MSVPSWVQDAVFYQIFPDRFANGDTSNDPPNVQPWGAQPTTTGFMGGDLRGIIEHLDYVQDLGANAIYLNPIFLSPSNHRYNATDYGRIDPKLGSEADFDELVQAVHGRGMHLILDGVFNHTGRGFFAFADILENQQESPYKDWYTLNRFPVRAYGITVAKDYLAWWNFPSMPKLNQTNRAVREYILDVARHWIEKGADGWRLDVPNEINDDGFWLQFRQTVKAANPDAYLVGEIWDGDGRWVGDGHFDGLTQYPFREATLGFLNGTLSADKLADRLDGIVTAYPRDNAFAMYIPLGSHDTERVATMLRGDARKLRMAFALQFAFPGAPAVYYGDEVGLTGGKDPENRGAFPWEPGRWDQALRDWVKHLTALRRRQVVLRRGDMRRVLVNNERRCYGFQRELGEERAVVLLNASEEAQEIELDAGALGWGERQTVKDLLSGAELPFHEGKMSVESMSCLWIV